MIDLSQHIPNIRTKKQKNVQYIWGRVRKKWLILTPEEMVRQSVIHFLIDQRKYSERLISVEKTIEYYHKRKRYDIVVYNKLINPIILVECKSSDVPLNQAAQEQAAIYDQIINGQYVWLTNGYRNIIFQKDFNLQQYRQVDDIPQSDLI